MRKRPIDQQPEADSHDTRERIIEAAMKVFTKCSVDSTSLRTIAKESGVASSMVIYHFQNKENLYRAVLDRAYEVYSESVADLIVTIEAKEKIDRLEAIELVGKWLRRMTGALAQAMTEKDWKGTAILYEYVYPSTFYEELYKKYIQRAYQAWAKIVMAATGNEDPQTAYFQMAVMYGMVIGFSLQREQLKHSLGIDHFQRDDSEQYEKTVIGNAFFMLGIERSPGKETKNRRQVAGRTEIPELDWAGMSAEFMNHRPLPYPVEPESTNAKERIIEAAISVFTKYSVDMTSIRMISDEAGVANSMVIYHFETKEKLYQVVLERVSQGYLRLFKDLLERVEAKAQLSRPEAVEILCQWICRMVDALCRDLPAVGWKDKIILYEYLYPSTSYDEYYHKNLHHYYHAWSQVIMSVTENKEPKTAAFQIVNIFGQIIGFRLQLGQLKRAIGIDGFSEDDLETIRKMVIDNTLFMLDVKQ